MFTLLHLLLLFIIGGIACCAALFAIVFFVSLPIQVLLVTYAPSRPFWSADRLASHLPVSLSLHGPRRRRHEYNLRHSQIRQKSPDPGSTSIRLCRIWGLVQRRYSHCHSLLGATSHSRPPCARCLLRSSLGRLPSPPPLLSLSRSTATSSSTRMAHSTS